MKPYEWPCPRSGESHSPSGKGELSSCDTPKPWRRRFAPTPESVPCPRSGESHSPSGEGELSFAPTGTRPRGTRSRTGPGPIRAATLSARDGIPMPLKVSRASESSPVDGYPLRRCGITLLVWGGRKGELSSCDTPKPWRRRFAPTPETVPDPVPVPVSRPAAWRAAHPQPTALAVGSTHHTHTAAGPTGRTPILVSVRVAANHIRRPGRRPAKQTASINFWLDSAQPGRYFIGRFGDYAGITQW